MSVGINELLCECFPKEAEQRPKAKYATVEAVELAEQRRTHRGRFASLRDWAKWQMKYVIFYPWKSLRFVHGTATHQPT